MTFDGRTGMSLTWNDLGLVEKVSLNDTDLVNYSYLADGTKVSALDGDGDGLLYLGSLIYRKQEESISLESAGFAGGRFVARETAAGSKVMVPMIHVADHLGSVRAVVDGVSGEVVETNDYYPFGSRWNTTASLTDQTNRFRYNSKEEQSSLYPASFRDAVSYIDYGARQYDPVLGRWFAQDPLSEKYYGISPYAFCAGNPVNFVDLDGRSWYYNADTGGFVAHIDDDDDYIYLVTSDEMQKAKEDNGMLSLYRRDDNMFGQLVMDGLLDESIVNNVISDLFSRANTDENGTTYVNIDVPILINNEMNAYAQVRLINNTINSINVNPIYVYKGYDSMLIFAHEIGHLVEINNKTISINKNAREISADQFARGHWVYKKASDFAKEILSKHENQYH